MISDLNLSPDSYYWIGVNDVVEDETWVNMDGLEAAWLNFGGVEPNGETSENAVKI